MSNGFEVKGWCPGALRPMASGDGLVVRVRLSGGVLAPAIARALADLAATAGNGLVDLTQRANVQLRGVSDATLPEVHARLAALGLLDADAAREAIRNIVVAPLARSETLALVKALEARLAAAPGLTALPAKFGFLVDDGTWPPPAGIAVDVHLVRRDGVWSVAVPEGDGLAALGTVAAADVPAVAERLAAAFVEMRGRNGRMAGLMREPGMARRLAHAAGIAVAPAALPLDAAPAIIGPTPLGGGRTALGVGVPLGQCTADQLRAIADIAEAHGADAIRLTPWRAVLLVVADTAAPAASHDLATAGLVLDPADPRRAVVACAGRPACPQGEMPARKDALALADVAARMAGEGVRLHVSGCAKGCARPARTAATLVGRAGCYDLVLDGTPQDRPRHTGLDLAAARDALLERNPQ